MLVGHMVCEESWEKTGSYTIRSYSEEVISFAHLYEAYCSIGDSCSLYYLVSTKPTFR